MKNDSGLKPEYDFKTLLKADPARHRAILARGASSATVRQEDGLVTVRHCARARPEGAACATRARCRQGVSNGGSRQRGLAVIDADI